MWARRYTGVGGMGDTAQAVAVDPAGRRVFVTGYSLGASTATDYVTISYNAVTGARRWLRRYDSPDGSRVFVTGSSRPGSNADHATVAYDAATGAQLCAPRTAPGASGEQPHLAGPTLDLSVGY
jgi:hypothetical protein